MEMDGEVMQFIKIWICAVSSLTYCYFISSNIPKPTFRLISLLPVLCLLTLLPLNLHSITLGGLTTFFLTWLANFKLLLFSFNQGPLSLDPSISLSHFISIACFPIKLKNKNPSHHPQQKPISPSSSKFSLLSIAINLALLSLLSLVYEYKLHLHLPPQIFSIYMCCYMYVGLELDLAIVAYLTQKFLGVELEPQFDKPYLSTSLQDFWGRRWNLMVSNILRPAVYEPARWLCCGKLGMAKRTSQLAAVFITFTVSGLMHELVFYYLGRVRPSWEVTLFFVVQGVLVVLEIVMKRSFGSWRLHPVVSWVITVGILAVTGTWLFFPPLLRCKIDDRIRMETIALLECMF